MMYGQEGGYGSVPKKKKTGLILGIILFLVVVIVGGFYAYKTYFAKNSIEILLDKAFSGVEMAVVESDYDSAVMDFSASMKFNSADDETNQIFSIFNKIDFNGSYGIDFDKNVMSMDLETNYDDKDLVDIDFYSEYGRGYFYFDGLYDKYIDMPIEGYSELFKRDTTDTRNLIVGLKKAIMESLKDEYYIIEKEGNGITKTTLDLSGDDYKTFSNDVRKSLLNNKVFLDSLGNVLEMSDDEVRKEFEESIEEESNVNFILYTKGTKFIKFELVEDDDKLVIKNDNNTYKYEYYEKDILMFSGDVKVTINNNDYKFLISYYDEEEKVGFEIEVDEKIEINGEVEAKDISNSISYEKISDDDLVAIGSKLMENEGVVKIIDEVSKMINYDEGSNDNSSI